LEVALGIPAITTFLLFSSVVFIETSESSHLKCVVHNLRKFRYLKE
jgi:hypothetical protein